MKLVNLNQNLILIDLQIFKLGFVVEFEKENVRMLKDWNENMIILWIMLMLVMIMFHIIDIIKYQFNNAIFLLQ